MNKEWIRKYFLYAVVLLIGTLLLGNIYLIYRNSFVIDHNRKLQEEAEAVKVSTLDIIRNLHLLDLGIRGYALVKNEQLLSAFDSAYSNKDRIFAQLEEPLRDQKFPREEFYVLRDSVESYFLTATKMRELLKDNEREQFLQILNRDPGYDIWMLYKKFSGHVYAFENNIVREAKVNYDWALKKSYWLQIILFLITLPTSMYTAYYASKTLALSEQLRKSEGEKNKMLLGQNELLERMVTERTYEIVAQNEEIISQNEEIVTHNEQLLTQQDQIESQRNILVEQNRQLHEAKQIIEDQNKLIQKKNEELKDEVERQTQDVKKTNLELIEHNSRLEQFAYIISHNLRAPMARLIGLSSILDFAKTEEEKSRIIQLMIKSTSELDAVIKDLSFILGIQKLSAQVLCETKLSEVMGKVTKMLDAEIRETNARVITDFISVDSLYSLPAYIESIFYNLISNAIKYRHSEKLPFIEIKSSTTPEFIRIVVSDNGLGIDLPKYKDALFNLYKRFHFHVEGKGLGLYLVKTQVEALGGRIEVESKMDEGTSFTIFFKR